MSNNRVDVKCCEASERNGIYFHYDYNRFYLLMETHPIEYCPWCGILLDINLVEKYKECHDLNISNDDLIRA